MLFIVTENYRQARNIARLDFQLKPTEWRYVQECWDLQGVKDADVCFCGTYRNRRDIYEIEEVVNYMIAIGRVKEKSFDELSKSAINKIVRYKTWRE